MTHVILIAGCILAMSQVSKAASYDFERLADAIKIEEGNNPNWLYGVHHSSPEPLSEPEARRRCVKTCKRVYAQWECGNKKKDFVTYLGLLYCPLNAANWSKNVSRIFEQCTSHQKSS